MYPPLRFLPVRSVYLSLARAEASRADIQTSGTAIFSNIYLKYGWPATGGSFVAFCGVALLTLLARGPHEIGWIGWHGGTQLFQRDKLTDLRPTAITEIQNVRKANAAVRRKSSAQPGSEGVASNEIELERGEKVVPGSRSEEIKV